MPSLRVEVVTRCRSDNNQEQVVSDLRAIGASVKVVSQYALGFDLLVGYRGANYVVEVKHPGYKEALTVNERVMSENWRGEYLVVDSAEDFLWQIDAVL